MHFTCKWILVSGVFKNIQETIGSIPIDLLSFNEPRYQARYLSIYRDLWILNFKIYFSTFDDKAFLGFHTLGF